MISCIVFFSSFAGSAAQVILGTGGVYIFMSLAGLYSKAKKYLSIRLTDSLSLYNGELVPSDYTAAVVITAAVSIVLIAASLPLTHKRQL